MNSFLKMLENLEFLLLSILILLVGVFVNPLLLLEGLTNLLKRQKGLTSAKRIEPKLLAYHQKTLEKIEKQVQTQVREELAKMASKHTATLTKLETTIGGDYDKTRREIKDAAEKYLEDTKLTLAGLVEKAEKRVNDELNAELEKTFAEIQDYKAKRLQKIDNEIVHIVEKTIYKTLGKGLNLEDQIDTIYEALADAKEEGFFETNAK